MKAKGLDVSTQQPVRNKMALLVGEHPYIIILTLMDSSNLSLFKKSLIY